MPSTRVQNQFLHNAVCMHNGKFIGRGGELGSRRELTPPGGAPYALPPICHFFLPIFRWIFVRLVARWFFSSAYVQFNMGLAVGLKLIHMQIRGELICAVCIIDSRTNNEFKRNKNLNAVFQLMKFQKCCQLPNVIIKIEEQ